MVTDTQTNRVHTVTNDETAANVHIHHRMQMNEQVNYAFRFVLPFRSTSTSGIDIRFRSIVIVDSFYRVDYKFRLKLKSNNHRIPFHSPIISFERFLFIEDLHESLSSVHSDKCIVKNSFHSFHRKKGWFLKGFS